MKTAPKTNPAFSPQWQGWVVLVIAGAFAVGNAAFMVFVKQGDRNAWTTFVAAPWLGTIFAQIGLVSTWCVFANIPGLRRVLGTIGLIVLLVSPVVIDNLIFRRGHAVIVDETVGVVLVLSIITITAQYPLWILKMLFGWRITNERMPPANRRGQFSLQHLLTLMAVTGILIVAIQNMIWFAHVRPNDVLTGVVAILLLPGIAMLASVVPALLALLRLRQAMWLAWGFYSVGAILFLGLAVLIAEKRVEDAFEVMAPLIGLPIGLSIPLALARREGYRLMMGWDVESQASRTSHSSDL